MDELKDLRKAKVAELISLMAGDGMFSSIPERAFEEFVKRYKEPFWTLCKEFTGDKQKFYRDIALETYQSSFAEIYSKAGEFKKIIKKVSDKDVDITVLAWLGEIAQRSMDGFIKKEDGFSEMHELVRDYNDYNENLHEVPLTPEEKQEEDELRQMGNAEILQYKHKLDHALAMLSRRDREILLEYFKPKGARKYLLKDRISYICSRWKITPDNMPQIKHRALKKVYSLCFDHEKNTETGAGSVVTPRTKAGK